MTTDFLSRLKSVTSTKDIVTLHGEIWLFAELDDVIESIRDRVWTKALWKAGPALVHKRSGNISYYHGQGYNPEYFELVNDAWTHDHCLVCNWRLDENEDPEHGVGYVHEASWICQECYRIFIEKKDGPSNFSLSILEGNLLDQDVDVIVNPWNRNIIPWWLLLPQGVSGAIKKRAGYRPFIEIGWPRPIPLGKVVQTSAGRLPYKGIIHVAGINMLWRASEKSIFDSVINSIRLAKENHFHSIAFPLIGTGSGGFDPGDALKVMLRALQSVDYNGRVVIVVYKKT